MKWFELVLGDDFALFLFVAAISGIISGFTEAQQVSGKSENHFDTQTYTIVKLAIVTALLALAYLDTTSIAISIGHAAVVVGIYKIVKTYASAFLVWRAGAQPNIAVEKAEVTDG